MFFLAQLCTFAYIGIYFSVLAIRYKSGIVSKEMLAMPKARYENKIQLLLNNHSTDLKHVKKFMSSVQFHTVGYPLWMCLDCWKIVRELLWVHMCDVEFSWENM